MTPRTQTDRVECGMLPMIIEIDQGVYQEKLRLKADKLQPGIRL